MVAFLGFAEAVDVNFAHSNKDMYMGIAQARIVLVTAFVNGSNRNQTIFDKIIIDEIVNYSLTFFERQFIRKRADY